jgi:hypothetical protein
MRDQVGWNGRGGRLGDWVAVVTGLNRVGGDRHRHGHGSWGWK